MIIGDGEITPSDGSVLVISEVVVLASLLVRGCAMHMHHVGAEDGAQAGWAQVERWAQRGIPKGESDRWRFVILYQFYMRMVRTVQHLIQCIKAHVFVDWSLVSIIIFPWLAPFTPAKSPITMKVAITVISLLFSLTVNAAAVGLPPYKWIWP